MDYAECHRTELLSLSEWHYALTQWLGREDAIMRTPWPSLREVEEISSAPVL